MYFLYFKKNRFSTCSQQYNLIFAKVKIASHFRLHLFNANEVFLFLKTVPVILLKTNSEYSTDIMVCWV